MKPILCFLLGLTLQIAHSQSSYFTIKQSQEYVDQEKTTTVRSVNSTPDNHTVIARLHKDVLTFETFDENAQGLKMMIREIDRKEEFAAELFYDNQVKIFTIYSPDKATRVLNCHIYDVANHEYEKQTLFETTVEKNQGLFSGQNKRQTNIAISPNHKFLAIAVDDLKKNANSYDVRVFDAQTLEPIYNKNYYNNPDKFYSPSDMIVNNLGEVFNVGKEYASGRRDKKDDKANYAFVINKISAEAVKTEYIQLDENEFIQNLSMQQKDGNLSMVGYYSEKNSFGIKGLTHFMLDMNNLSVKAKTSSPLPIDVYQDLYGARAEQKKDRDLINFTLDHSLEDAQGNRYLIAEEFFVTNTYVSTGVGGGVMVSTPHYDDILITKFNPQGELLWGRSIFKQAQEPSYNVFLKDEQLHVILNSGKNLTEKSDGRLKVSKGFLESSALYDFVFDANGNVQHEKLQDNKGNTTFIPYRGNYANDKFVMYNHSEKKKRLMILEPK